MSNDNLKSRRILKHEKMKSEELLKFMNTHGVNVKDLSEILGVTMPAVRFWLNGTREISILISRLIRLFDKNPHLLREF